MAFAAGIHLPGFLDQVDKNHSLRNFFNASASLRAFGVSCNTTEVSIFDPFRTAQ